jgi:hypothetical protein
MLRDFVVPVVREDQLFSYTCGAACTNIVLSHWGKNGAQLTVWQDIQAKTGTVNRPADALSEPGSFPTQHCDLCSSAVITGGDGKQYGDYHCWFTTPEAMAATINASSLVPVTVDYIADSGDAIRRIADSLVNFDVPAVFTTAPSLHWVVAYGYQYDDVLPPPPVPLQWNSQSITGLYVHNPAPVSAQPGQPTIQMVTQQGLEGLLMPIQCGASVRYNEHPVVGGAHAPGGGGPGLNPVVGPWAIFVAAVSLWLDPRRWLRYWFRPRRPGPPR